MELTRGQLEKLSTLFLNIAQAFFILAFAVSYFAAGAEIINAIKAFLLGFMFTCVSLWAERKKEEEVSSVL
jgi:hypothetical protein